VRILIDECVHAGVKDAFNGHAVKTVAEAGWGSMKDEPLLEYAQRLFDVFVTIDRSLERQNDLKNIDMGFVLARVPNNRIQSYQSIFGELKAAAERVKPGEVVVVMSSLLRGARPR
jgi:hypothetical protein